MKQITVIFSLLLSGSCFAQDTPSKDWRVFRKADTARTHLQLKDTVKLTLHTTPAEPGKVVIKQDSRIKDLSKRYAKMKHVQKGFRVQIFLGSRDGQSKARNKFMGLYPSYATYLDYQAPNFKVRVGDFKKRMDAEELLLEIRKAFPAAYIVPDEVELDRLP